MSAQVNDEHFAWRAAFAIMALFSALALVARVLGLLGFGVTPFFSDEFTVSLVYIPTLVLFVGLLAARRKQLAKVVGP